MRVFAYIARRYNSAAESTSLLSSVASLAITRLRLSMKRWDKGSELRITERLSLRLFLFFAVIYSTCKHALRKESTIKAPVDGLELFDDQRRKTARII